MNIVNKSYANSDNFHHIFVYGWIEMCGFFAYLYKGQIHIINVVWGLNSYTHDTLWDEITHQYPEGGLTKLWLNGKTWMINFVQNFYVGTLIYHYSDVINGVSNHQSYDCLFKHLFRCRSSKTSKLCVTGLCEGNSQVTSEIPTQKASNPEFFFHLMTSSSSICKNQSFSWSMSVREAPEIFIQHCVACW